MSKENKENEVSFDPSLFFNALMTGAVGMFYWDKRQDKLKLKELEDKVNIQGETIARQDERHKSLDANVVEMKSDVKEIKRFLMEKE